jgi:polygalacturonase
MPVHVEHVNNLHLLILGKMVASKNVAHWPFKNNDTYWEFLTFYFCDGLEVSGGGRIDGRGYHWWMLCFLNYKKYLPNQSARPHLLHLFACRNTSLHDLTLKNSPQFHLKMDDCHTSKIYNLNIKVNTTAQLNLLKHFSL